MNDLEEDTKDYNKMTMLLAINYGGRDEIVHAAKILSEQVKRGEIQPDEITEDMFYHLIGTNEKTSKAYYHSVFGEDYPYQKIKDYRDQLRKEYFNSHPLEVKKGLYDLLQMFYGRIFHLMNWIKH